MIKCDGNHAVNSITCFDPECWIDENRPFNIWWHREGSGLPPKKGEDHEIHTRDMCLIAWDNGMDTARKDIEPLTNSIGAILAYLLTQEQSFKKDLAAGKITVNKLLEWGIKARIKGDHIELLI